MQSIRRLTCRLSSCVRQVHSLSRKGHTSLSLHQRWGHCHRRLYSTEPLATPALEGDAKEYAPKIQTIVDEISSLTLLEVADLNELLKKTLHISDAPVMAMGTAAVGTTQQVQEEEEEEEKAPVKSLFTVKLIQFEPTKKVALIKEIKTHIAGMNLVQAKKFVEGAPQPVKSDIPKEEAEQLKAALESVGATVELE